MTPQPPDLHPPDYGHPPDFDPDAVRLKSCEKAMITEERAYALSDQ